MKTCPFCAEAIQDAAIICRFCRADLSTGKPFQVPAPSVVVKAAPQAQWSPGVAGVLSLVIPGAGQIYKGHPLRGLCWLVFVIVGYMAFILPGLILHGLCILMAMGGDPYDDPDRYGGLDPIQVREAEMALASRNGPGLGEMFAVLVHPVAAWKRGNQADRSSLIFFGVVFSLIGIAILVSRWAE